MLGTRIGDAEFHGLVRKLVRESNRIEGIRRTTHREVDATRQFLDLPTITVPDVCRLVAAFQVSGVIRDRPGLNVYIGRHRPPPGGLDIVRSLEILLDQIRQDQLTPYQAHFDYETLHPFTDGNGRSGRAIWMWQMLRLGEMRLLSLGFLHAFYYQTLAASRR